MTSLMVIFILLLLVFVKRTASIDAAMTDALLKTLRDGFQSEGFNEKTIRPDPRDKNAILVIVPDRLMNFETGKSALRPEGEQFLKQYIPKLAGILCIRGSNQVLNRSVVEGHTDKHPYARTYLGREPKP